MPKKTPSNQCQACRRDKSIAACKIERSFQTKSLRRKTQLSKENGPLSFQKIADDSNLNVMVVRRIMGGRQTPKLGEAYAIAAALRTSVGELTNSSERAALKASADKIDKIMEEREALLAKLQECDSSAALILNTLLPKNS